ncbi:MAG: HNH endonuclease signature motif containing protein [Thermodesulfobacteriota bacterium]
MGVGTGIGCGEPAQVVDHILPIAQGVANVESNPQSLCKRCHNRKTAGLDNLWGKGGVESLETERR